MCRIPRIHAERDVNCYAAMSGIAGPGLALLAKEILLKTRKTGRGSLR